MEKMTAKEENGFKISPKDKALDLFVKFYERYPESIYSNEAAKIEAKYCSLIAVDEMLSNDGWSSSREEWARFKKYFEEVKQEIEKL